MAQAKSASRKTRKPKGDVTFSSVVNTIAERKGIDPVTAGKSLRSRIRSAHRGDDHAKLLKRWPALKSKDAADGNRYPNVPRDLARDMIAGDSLT